VGRRLKLQGFPPPSCLQLGIDDELVSLLGKWSPIPVTYAGGARTLVGARAAHLETLAWAIRAGSGMQLSLICSAALKHWQLPHTPHLVLLALPSRSTQDDLERVRKAGGGRVDITVGSALDIFGGQLPYADVVAWHRQQQEAAGEPQWQQPSGSGSGGGGSQQRGEQQGDGTVLYRF